MGENVGGGSQVCEEGGKLKLKLEAILCILEVETFQICNLLMGTVAFGQGQLLSGQSELCFW